MLDDLEDWLKKPADKKWLPNLKSFTFKGDARTFDQFALRSEARRTAEIRDVSLPPVAVKHEGGEAGEGSADVDEGDSMDTADLNARKVLVGDDFEEDEDDDDYEDNDADDDDDAEGEEDDEDEDMIKEEEDDDDAQLNFGAEDDHNPILLPHITSLIASVMHKMKSRNLELQIVA
ncbi:hypothetical protein CPB84DRAFT_1783074 [Gymnopilus junonius]|uniref:Uncharacterized protein n=1 Tax=Gymnopilus junonius TaxID=109634 RepID=A0A9P5TKN6_GYMJU|nr:hypothetical protein CPB84DRAFT_1783074 [Gymnopilus junonius]